MVILLLQSLAVLVVAYLVGLPVGGVLGGWLRPAKRAVKKPVAAPVVEQVPEPAPEPKPVPVYRGIDLAPVPAAVAVAPVKPKWEERIFFPTQTFGIAVRCCPPEINIIRRPGRSPLADLAPAEQQDILARTRLSEEPERLWKPEKAPDDLTGLGMNAEEARTLNGLGIFHAWQIAEWSPQHVLWIARRLKDPSRVVNDNWIGKAARMAAG